MNSTVRPIQKTVQQKTLETSAQRFQEIRKSRAGREIKKANATVEPNINQNSSTNMVSTYGWGGQTKNGSFVQSPNG